MKIGIHLPQLGRASSPEFLVEIAKKAEALGFDDLWTADHVAVPVGLAGMPSFFPEPVPILAAVASHTTRVGLGTSVIVGAYRNPMHFAKQWATLDWMSSHRTILGLGAGWLEKEFEAIGIPFSARGKRLDDYVRGWRAAWAGETTYSSTHFSFDGVRINPQPPSPIPIWIGGPSPGAMRRAAWCDGWQGTWAPLDTFTERKTMLKDALEAAERPRDTMTISIHCEFRLETQLDKKRWSDIGDGHGAREMLIGSPDHIGNVLEEYKATGLDHMTLVPIAGTQEEWHEHLDAADVVRRRLKQM